MAEGNKIPEIRFKGFSKKWEERTLDVIAEVLDGDRGNNYPNGNELQETGHTLFLSASNVTTNGFKFDTNQYITEEKSNSMGNGKLAMNDIVLTSRGSIGHIAWYNEDIQPQLPFARINSGMLIIRSNDFVMPCIVAQFLKSPFGKKKIDLISFGSAQPQLTKKSVCNYTATLPNNKAEQTKIGNYFQQLDTLITLHQDKHDKLLNVKKAMLEKMFPKKGADVPEIRFKGFSEKWVERDLGEVTDVYDGTHQTPKYTTTGVMFLSVENIKTLRSEKYISKKSFEKEFKISPKKKDVLMTRIGDIGTANVVESDAPKAYYVTLALLKYKNLDPYFLKGSISSESVNKDIWHRTLHIAFPKKINKNEIAKVVIPYPKPEEEQTKIGNFFKNLDTLLTLHQSELEKLKNIKKACLDKMFV